MRKKVFSVAVTCSLLAVVAVATAYAQLPGTEVRARIPFDFSVRGKTLPAGEYEIRRLGDEPGGLMISSVNRRGERAVFETEPVEPKNMSSRGELVFNRYGDSYFLSEVFGGGGETGRELTPTRQERTLRREMAGNPTTPETVAVAGY